MSQTKWDRVIAALKGNSRLADPTVRSIVTQTSMRDMTPERIVGHLAGSTATGQNGTTSLTDPSGNPYAMTNIVGFAQGATLR